MAENHTPTGDKRKQQGSATQSLSVGKGALHLTAAKIMTTLIALVSNMLLARFRTLSEYGTYSQILLVINLFTTLLMLGLPNSINYFLARAETQEEKAHFLSVYYTLSTVLSMIIGFVLVLSIPLIEGYFHNPTIRHFYYFLALYPWYSIISSSVENVLVVYQKTNSLMLYKVAVSVLTLSVILIVKWAGWGFSEYMLLFVGVHCLIALSVYGIVNRVSGGISILFNNSLIKSIFVFSIPIGLATVVGTLNTEIDKLMIGYLMSTDQMSIYTNAARELPLTIVASSITAVLLPQMTRMIKDKKISEAVSLWGYATELSLIIMGLVVAVFCTYAEEVMTILYSEKYLPGVGVFRVYTLNLLLRITYFGTILNAYGKTRKIFICSLISLGLNLLLNPLFYAIFGMIGPAMATFLSLLVVGLMQLKMTSDVSDVPFSRLFPWKRFIIIIIVNFIFSVVFWMIKRDLPLDMYIGDVAEAIALGIVWAVTYIFAMKKQLLDRWHRINN